MNDKDLIQRFLFENRSVRGQWVRLEESYQTIVQQHQYPPMIQQLLGEVLVAVSLLTAIIKFKGKLIIQFQSTGKLKLLLAQCDHEFHLRALADWDGEIEANELSALMKEGTMAVMIDPQNGGQRYQGIVDWQGKTLAESIEGYFKYSEQLETRIWIAVNETSVTGLLLQVLPQEESKKQIQREDWEHLIHLTNTLSLEELSTLDCTTLLKKLYAEDEVRVFKPASVTFRCNCSNERSENALLVLGREEVDEELKEKQKIVVTCEFCNTEYHFDRIDVERIFSKGSIPPASTQVH